MIPPGVIPPYSAPIATAPSLGVLGSPSAKTSSGLVLGGLQGAIELIRGGTTLSQRLGAVHDVLAGIFSYTPLGPLIAIEGGLVRLAGGFYEQHLAKKAERKRLGRYYWTTQGQMAAGHHDIYALRAGLSRAGVNPETILPLADPVQSSPAYQYTASWQYDARNRFGKRHTETREISVPASYVPDPAAAASVFYDPETRATGTEYGALIKYGTGPAADLARQARQEEYFAYLQGRPTPGAGTVPASIVRTTKGP